MATILAAMDLTTDESTRFQLWEAALDHVRGIKAQAVIGDLEAPGRTYSAKAGRQVLSLARSLPEPLLVKALQIDEEDLRKAAVDRHGAASDVGGHRRAVDAERRQARAWQALVLLSIASHDNQDSRPLLVRWAEEADAELADAARAALVMLGDEESTELLQRRAAGRGASNLMEAMVAQVTAPSLGASRVRVRAVTSGSGGDVEGDLACTSCGRKLAEVSHMMVGGADGNAVVCEVCLAEIALHRRDLANVDPEAVCALSGRSGFETAAMYTYEGLVVCREVVDLGLGLLERQTVDRFLAGI